MKKVLAIITALLMSAVVASATTLTFITTNGTQIATNTFTITAPTGASLASLTFITTNGTVISTNTFTTPQIEAAYFANGVGYTYGTLGGHMGFFGTYPVVAPSSTPGAATGATYSNQLKAATTQSSVTPSTMSITVMVVTNGVTAMGTNYTYSGIVTGVTVNGIYGFADSTAGVATNQVIATTSVALVNAIRTGLMNLGLMK